jgi:glycosyltransferase involved in cell wall biosynthesis
MPRSSEISRVRRIMLSVIIPTHDCERALVRTLAALVPGAAAGLVSEVLVVDAGSHDQTEYVADHAGCIILHEPGPLGRRLRAGARAARTPWLLFLRPGAVIEPSWTAEVRVLMEQVPGQVSAAAFRRAAVGHGGWREIVTLAAATLGAQPHPQQGLLIARDFYDRTGGHSASATDPEREYLRRIGRRKIRILSTVVHHFD